jgi:hypothetical protein
MLDPWREGREEEDEIKRLTCHVCSRIRIENRWWQAGNRRRRGSAHNGSGDRRRRSGWRDARTKAK